MMMRLTLALCPLMLCSLALAQEPAKSFQPLEIQGLLAETDPLDFKLNKPCKLHRVAFTKGRTYIIDLISMNFDSYLRLEDPACKPLAEDDDTGGNLNSRITFTAPSDGNYQISATTLNGAVGNYVLKIRETDPLKETKLRLAKAVDIGPDGLVCGGKLDNRADPKSPVNPPNACKVYSVNMKANQTYVIDLESKAFDSFLHVLDSTLQSVAADDDSGGNLNARVTFRPMNTGTYHVLATSLDGREGAFALRIRAQDPLKETKLRLTKAVDIGGDGLAIDGKLDNKGDSRSPVQPTNACKVFSVNMKANQTYVIDLQSKAFDSFLHVLDSNLQSVAADDDGGGNLNARVTFRPMNSGIYHLLATSLDGHEGAFALRVRAQKD
jgi:hypothetical protein